MSRRRFDLHSIAYVSLLLAVFGACEAADYGVTTSRPLSDPRKAEVDEGPCGSWRAVIKDRTYYLHAGTGNIVGKFNWMELVLVNPGETRPSFYLYHFVCFPSTIGGERYINIVYTSKLIPQLRGSKIDQLISSVVRYEILKYKVTGDHLDVWSADQDFIRKAIADGKIKGAGAKIDDTPENLTRFIRSFGPKLFVNKFRYTRIPEPPAEKPAAPPSGEKGKGAEKPADPPAPAKKAEKPKKVVTASTAG